MRLQVIQNEKGIPSGVYIPIKQWNNYNKKHYLKAWKRITIYYRNESK